MNHGYAGALWLKDNIECWNKIDEASHQRSRKKSVGPFVPMTVSPFGERVADLLGFVFAGLYHAYKEVRRVDWSSDHCITITTSKTLSTFDFSDLTQLVILCHDQKIRLEIEGAAPRYMRLHFSPRETREGSSYTRHPTIESAIERIRTAAGSEVLP